MKILVTSLAVLAASLPCRGAERHHVKGSVGTVHLRIWKPELPGIDAVHFESRPAAGGAPHEIVSLGKGYQFDDYVELPVGDSRVSCTIPGQKEPFAVVSLAPQGGPYCTLLLKPAGSVGVAPQAELISDLPAAPASSGDWARFSVYNFAPGLRDLRITVGRELAFGLGGFGGHLLLDGLKRGKYEIHTTGKDANGVPFEWINVGDFTGAARQTLLIYPDPYGRIRPMMSVDGPKG